MSWGCHNDGTSGQHAPDQKLVKAPRTTISGPDTVKLQAPEQVYNAVNIRPWFEYMARFSSDESNSDETDSSGEYSDKEELNESVFMSDLKKWFYNYNIPYSHLDALLKTLKPYHSELPVSSKTFLKTQGSTKRYKIQRFIPDDMTNDPQFHQETLELQFSVDGLPLFRSSNNEFCPLLGKVHSDKVLYEPFVISVHCGKGKPTCVNTYFKQFIEELNTLLKDGGLIKIDNELQSLLYVPALTNAVGIGNDDHEVADPKSPSTSLLSQNPAENSFEDIIETAVEQNQQQSSKNDTHGLDLASFKAEITKHFDETLKRVKDSLKSYIKEKNGSLEAKIISIQYDVSQIKTFVQENRPFKDSKNVLSIDKISEIYGHTFPILEYEEFKIFDKKIVEDPYDSFKIYFGCNINTSEEHILVKVITPIFKTFFARDLIIQFTAQKKTKNKSKNNILKDTNFYKCFADVMNHAYNRDITVLQSNKVLTLLGAMINNAYDWEGYRAKRIRASVSESDSDDNVVS
ncbi:uncharacterized protein LOC100678528 [Nasonia vitripennis]|uniref:Uncharacterized protein n=1 Tax=Nasonia vitripennis TaxID=7425 RepID=A0A7M7QPT6_NASVI|nr:uncharacterized protein LOC100678528 [Nasonia vitripennis]